MIGPWGHFVVYDDDPDDAKAFAEYLKKIFKRARLEINVTETSSQNDVRAALNSHPDFVICDVSLGQERNSAGLEFIRNGKIKYPHLTFVAITMQYEKLRAIADLFPQPDLVLSKNRVNLPDDQKFEDNLLGFFLSKKRQNRFIRVSSQPEIERKAKLALGWHSFDRSLFECLIRQVFNDHWEERVLASHLPNPAELRDADEIVDEVRLSALEGLTERQAVFLATPILKERDYQVRVVLKFCKIVEFHQELANFAKYVKWMLPYGLRVDVLGTGVSANLAVIGYSVAFGGTGRVLPLSHYARLGNADIIRQFVEIAFSPNSRYWYGAVLNSNESLASALIQRYFRRHGPDALSAHREKVEEMLADDATFYAIYPGIKSDDRAQFFLRLRRLLMQAGKRSTGYQTCICHGDLHFGNIMTNIPEKSIQLDPGHFVFIDFEDTGRLHSATDFIVFENAIRKDSTFPIANNGSDYYRIEKDQLSRMLVSKDSELQEANGPLSGKSQPIGLELIALVRRYYFLNFSSPSTEHYVFHLLMFTLAMMNKDNLENIRGPFLVAELCAAVDCLAGYRDRAGGLL